MVTGARRIWLHVSETWPHRNLWIHVQQAVQAFVALLQGREIPPPAAAETTLL